ncbi:MAG: hypothetical protein OXU88_09160, partial [Gammaproteobacteria bacterium]|nr:hypothetical protein [Gammaproteobacteria bacterium]
MTARATAGEKNGVAGDATPKTTIRGLEEMVSAPVDNSATTPKRRQRQSRRPRHAPDVIVDNRRGNESNSLCYFFIILAINI